MKKSSIQRKKLTISPQKNARPPWRLQYVFITAGFFSLVLVGVAVSLSQRHAVLSAQTLLARGGDDGGDSHRGSGGSGPSDHHGSSGADSHISGNSEVTTESDNHRPDRDHSSPGSPVLPPNNTSIEREQAEEQKSLKPAEGEQAGEQEHGDTSHSGPNNELRSKIILNTGEKIETRSKDGRQRIDITANGVQVRFEVKGNQLITKAEQENGEEIELADGALDKIDDRLADNDIKIATAGANGFIIKRGETAAKTSFPLSIDFATNRLIITTPAGERKLNVLPDKAIENLLAAGIITKPIEQPVASDEAGLDASSSAGLLTLTQKNGIPVYEIKGVSQQKLLGLLPVSIEKKVSVSAQNGIALASDESIINRLLDLLSF